MSFTERNHYVPRWYQRRFFPRGVKEKKFFYLDLRPDKVKNPNGLTHTRKAIRKLGAASCFCQDNLYTLYFGKNSTDVIEKQFFGRIDSNGVKAVEFFSDYDLREGAHEAYQNLMPYMDAQKLRTPKGLDFLRLGSRSTSHQAALHLMGQLWQVHCTIWAEGVWEVVSCVDSPTKFILTDHPVTTYNRAIFPLSKGGKYPLDSPIDLVGTQTIFPLDLNKCLIITNLGYARNPRAKPTDRRINPRYFEQAVFDLRKIQTGRTLSEQEVRSVNYILKKRAARYIAAVEKEWLFPERFLNNPMWDRIGGGFFLRPDPRKMSFTTGILVGRNSGGAWGADEYGRDFDDSSPGVKKQRDIEWDTFHKSKEEWEANFGKLSTEDMKRYW